MIAVVEFGCYGAIGDFDTTGMTEEAVYAEAQDILNDFIASEGYNIVMVDSLEEY